MCKTSEPEKTAWYRKIHSGPPVQRLWQIAVGGAIFVAFIGVPLSVSLYRSQKRKFAEHHGLLVNPLQKMVYDQRVAVRNSLRAEEKAS